MMRKVVTVGVSLIVIAFVPITLFGVLLPVNEYRAVGIGDIPECDGPLTVMLFIAPSLVVYTAGAAYCAWLLRGRGRSTWVAALMVLCVVMLIAAGSSPHTPPSLYRRPDHRDACGEGW
jgi:hypothetical protein